MTNPESLPMTGSPQFSCKLEMFLWLIRHQDDPLVQSWWIGYEAAQRGVTLERALWRLMYGA